MKSIYNFTVYCVFLFASVSAMNGQTVIAQWNFNGSSDITIPGGQESPSPNVHIGEANVQLVGGAASGGFAAGSNNDPEEVVVKAYNFGWITTNYASPGSENKQRGVQFNVNTSGYNGIKLQFEQRLSNTANNTYVVQYAVNKNAPQWIDKETFTITPTATSGDDWHTRIVDFSSNSELSNNPNVAIRIVSAYDPATGNYNATKLGSAYSPTQGKVRYDMVTVSGTQALGVDDLTYDESSFYFYPNPVKGDFIHFNVPASVRIFDLMGKTVLKADEVNGLNVETLASGMYFIENQDKRIVKMIKN